MKYLILIPFFIFGCSVKTDPVWELAKAKCQDACESIGLSDSHVSGNNYEHCSCDTKYRFLY